VAGSCESGDETSGSGATELSLRIVLVNFTKSEVFSTHTAHSQSL
jgi:hypothetical protein